MFELSKEMMILVIAGGFLAAFVDSVVGGGGLVAVPVLLATGMPTTVVLGTNKLAGTMSSLTSTVSFMRSGHVDVRMVTKLFGLSLAGAVAGTLVLRSIPSDFLKPIVIVMLIAITVYTVFRKNWGSRSNFQGLTTGSSWLAALAAAGLGFYDGFFGPGTGAFLIFAFLMLGLDFVRAAGNAKVLNFGSNVASLSTFMLLGQVNYKVGIPMGIAMVFGSLLGSRVAIRKGSAYVRPLFIVVCTLLIGKQVWDLLK
ncbi:MAG TPA: TSUP family transporter [Candidatus Udaeobacter sp.]|nr:TSUP family transporter [Candidatus Udaeobacter sp.]